MANRSSKNVSSARHVMGSGNILECKNFIHNRSSALPSSIICNPLVHWPASSTCILATRYRSVVSA